MEEKNIDSIAELFKQLKFRKKTFGGVDEMDVWKKLEQVQKEYRKVLDIALAEKNAVIAEKENEIARLTELLRKDVRDG